jgi:hypothetical protein
LCLKDLASYSSSYSSLRGHFRCLADAWFRYGSSCYRKNPNHQASFCHPGDADYPTYVDHQDSDDAANNLTDSEDEYKPEKEVKVLPRAKHDAPVHQPIDDLDDDDMIPPPRKATTPAKAATSALSAGTLTQELQMALPDFLLGVTGWVDSCRDVKLAKRHLIAFEGEVAQFASDKATHIIVAAIDPESWSAQTKESIQANPSKRVQHDMTRAKV